MAVAPRSELPAIASQILEGCDLYFQYILRIGWIGIAYGTSPASLLLRDRRDWELQPRGAAITRLPAVTLAADSKAGRRIGSEAFRSSWPLRSPDGTWDGVSASRSSSSA